MKNLKVVVLTILILLIGMFILTGCSIGNGEGMNPTYTEPETIEDEEQAMEELKKNIEKEVIGITQSGDYVIKLKNNNDVPVYVDDVSVRFFDAEGNFVKKENTYDSYFCIPANNEVVTYVWGYDNNFSEYSKSEIEIMLGEPLYTYLSENFEVKANNTNEEIAVTIVNNNDAELDSMKINVVFLKEGSVVGIEDGNIYDEKIEANGGAAYINVDYPSDSDYEDVAFDEFKVYIISAYKR